MTHPSPALGLGGLVAYPLTPTGDGGRLDVPRFGALLDELIAAGADAIAVLGSSGAAMYFSEGQRMRIAEAALSRVGGRVPVMIGTGAMTTAETIRLSQHSAGHGASAALVVPVAYWRLTDPELAQHFRDVADAIDVPVCLYNNPRLTLTDMSPALIAQLAVHPNIRYLKECASDLARFAATRELAPQLHLASGRDVQALQAMREAGAQGWHSAMVNIAPRACVEVFRLGHAGRHDEAAAAWARLAPLTAFCAERGLIRALHAAFELLGRPVGPPPRPVLPLPPGEREELARLMRSTVFDTQVTGDRA